jgi:hypothetical protein
MQLQLNTDELNFLADTLLERVGNIYARRRLAPDAQGNADIEQGERCYDDLQNKVLMGDLRLDADELEQVADLLVDRKLYFSHEIARLPNCVLLLNLDQKLKLVERILERINEARAMI